MILAMRSASMRVFPRDGTAVKPQEEVTNDSVLIDDIHRNITMFVTMFKLILKCICDEL